ncbi:MAG: hypothetical protein A3G39_03065 [Deltaproteobacteria bacterium RIFCSPLOWO2_12_FULL_43_16]|nr:MAG: hypothetical protein A2Z89_05120 [Deltaproteobacteria bacterium GWA2_43_19]OGQ10821.1 MAG: hypothetical protein A3D30_03970 [Deltaproteobacteria bacterium RIFCSPHIGHO2_02_FULL_43_33]OGQ59904.1 MAG: hypothetical protein A3G39_03065 [Deltaproteobacteria bacterium RIFCSPLOWO2_12_FULL_43_16]HBR16687.1 hypothetical protein [Deltaproteobacteria bacterium]
MENKILILLGVFIFCMTLGLKDAMAAAATDVVCKNPCINSYEIEDGQVAATDIANNAITNAKIADGAVANTKILDGAVTTPKIADGAVTDAKITGPISSSKIQKPANVITVAKSGGDFTTIGEAINSITPTADNPYFIKVMPGTYLEMINMRSYIHLQGAGSDVVTIQSPATTCSPILWTGINISNVTNATISGFTITGGCYGIYSASSSVTIIDNIIKGYSALGIFNTSSLTVVKGNTIAGNGGNEYGIKNESSSPNIAENTIKGNYFGIINLFSSTPMITGNTITENRYGIANDGSAPAIIAIIENTIVANSIYGIVTAGPSLVKGNTIINNAAGGVYMEGGSPIIIYNKITNNGYADIHIYTFGMPVTPNISFNVYDTISGTTGVGQYNVNSNGDPAPAP